MKDEARFRCLYDRDSLSFGLSGNAMVQFDGVSSPRMGGSTRKSDTHRYLILALYSVP